MEGNGVNDVKLRLYLFLSRLHDLLTSTQPTARPIQHWLLNFLLFILSFFLIMRCTFCVYGCMFAYIKWITVSEDSSWFSYYASLFYFKILFFFDKQRSLGTCMTDQSDSVGCAVRPIRCDHLNVYFWN